MQGGTGQNVSQFSIQDSKLQGEDFTVSDCPGATVVSWKNNNYLRRSPSHKFGEAILFIRCIGKDKRAMSTERLATFKAMSQCVN